VWVKRIRGPLALAGPARHTRGMKILHYSPILPLFLLAFGGISSLKLGEWVRKQGSYLRWADEIGVIAMFVGFAGSVIVCFVCLAAIRRAMTQNMTEGPEADFNDAPVPPPGD
jgi:hypothetical protein